jgi:Zn-dependent protease
VRVFGIPVVVDVSWTIIGTLVGAAFYLTAIDAGEPVLAAAVIAVVGAVLLAAGVLGHELSHAVVARLRGIPVVTVTLFAFGGYSQLEQEPDRPADELVVAAAGPIASCALAAGLFAIRAILPEAWAGAGDVLMMLALVNLGVGLFNLLPGLPLDGGRVLRALLRRRRSARAATVAAARSGRALAIALVVVGLAGAAAGWLLALWNLPVGLFLYRLADASERDAGPATLVAEIMEPPGDPVSPDDPAPPGRYVPVVERGVVVGLVPPGGGEGPASRWMHPLRRSDLVDGQVRVVDVGRRLRRGRRPAVVTAGRRMVGVLPPEAIAGCLGDPSRG